MPYDIRESGGKYKVVKEDDGEVMGTHDTKEEARDQQQALYANEADDKKSEASIYLTLLRLANHLDKKGLFAEANTIDTIISKTADEGIPPFHYDVLKECVQQSTSLEECNELLAEVNESYGLDVPPLTKENYNEMKSKLNED